MSQLRQASKVASVQLPSVFFYSTLPVCIDLLDTIGITCVSFKPHIRIIGIL